MQHAFGCNDIYNLMYVDARSASLYSQLAAIARIQLTLLGCNADYGSALSESMSNYTQVANCKWLLGIVFWGLGR